MEHARRLLEQGNTSITEVSSLVGYKDSGYFSKVFKKYYGIAPVYYKRQAQKENGKELK